MDQYNQFCLLLQPIAAGVDVTYAISLSDTMQESQLAGTSVTGDIRCCSLLHVMTPSGNLAFGVNSACFTC